MVRKSFKGTLSATPANTSLAASEASTDWISSRTRASSNRPRLDPRPHLGARDLGGRGVLHQVVDRGRADALQPRIEVANADTDVDAQALVGDLGAGDLEVDELPFAYVNVVALAVDLVRAVTEHGVELRHRDGNEIRVRDPRAVEAVARLAALVLGDLRERDRVHVRVAP